MRAAPRARAGSPARDRRPKAPEAVPTDRVPYPYHPLPPERRAPLPCDASEILRALAAKAQESRDPETLGRALVTILREQFPQASWAGIYWLKGRELVLGPYAGPPTPHARIAVGQGVCGTAVAEDRDQVVPDVGAAPHYLACSPAVRSEIVVLIRARGRVVGQLDLDSEQPAAFGPDEHCVLKAVADSFGALLAG